MEVAIDLAEADPADLVELAGPVDLVDLAGLVDPAEPAARVALVAQENPEELVAQAELVELVDRGELEELAAVNGNTTHHIAAMHPMAIAEPRINLGKRTLVPVPARQRNWAAEKAAPVLPPARLAEEVAGLPVVPAAAVDRGYRRGQLVAEIEWAVTQHRERVMEAAAADFVAAVEIMRAPAAIEAAAAWAAADSVEEEEADLVAVAVAGSAAAAVAAAAVAVVEDAAVVGGVNPIR